MANRVLRIRTKVNYTESPYDDQAGAQSRGLPLTLPLACFRDRIAEQATRVSNASLADDDDNAGAYVPVSIALIHVCTSPHNLPGSWEEHDVRSWLNFAMLTF